MRGNLTIVFIALVAAVSWGLYQLSYEVQQLEKDLAVLNNKISDNQETVRILKAEWSYQNRPDNLQAMAAKYLPLLLVAPFQVATTNEVPNIQDHAIARQFVKIPIPRAKPKGIILQPGLPLVLATFKPSISEGARQ